MKSSSRPSRSRRAFALRDLLALSLCASVGLAIFTPLAASGSNQSRLQICTSRLKRISLTRGMYANDHANLLGSLQTSIGSRTWRTLGTRNYAPNSSGEIDSTSDQAVDTIRFRGNRDDITSISGWSAMPSYNYLVLADYLQESLPSPNYACPEDSNLLAWQSDPRNFNNLGVPSPVGPGQLSNANKRWPYMSSYISSTSAWSNDYYSNDRGAWFFSGQFYQRFGGFTQGRGDVGFRRFDEVAFPSARVDLYDQGSRHFTPRAVYWNFENAKQPLLFYDGVVRTTRTGATNIGWDWNNPRNLSLAFVYSMDFSAPNLQWFPGPPEGQPRRAYTFWSARFATTRDGLAGRDLP